jgi:hypothetical protein
MTLFRGEPKALRQANHVEACRTSCVKAMSLPERQACQSRAAIQRADSQRSHEGAQRGHGSETATNDVAIDRDSYSERSWPQW